MEQKRNAPGELHRIFLSPDYDRFSDGELLERFLTSHDEIAFENLVSRHAAMVLGVCRRVLRNQHDAEDAFQATFLVLLRKAAAVMPRDRVGRWLYGVAYRTALDTKKRLGHRRASEHQAEEHFDPVDPDENNPELRHVLDRELFQLPEIYRSPVLLCDLEGRSYKEAARELGLPEGTLSVRLSRARKILARRLKRLV